MAKVWEIRGYVGRAPVCYSSSLGLNQNISQIHKMGDISKGGPTHSTPQAHKIKKELEIDVKAPFQLTKVHVYGASPEVDPVEQVGHPPPDQQGTQARGVSQHLVEGEHHKVGLHQTQV